MRPSSAASDAVRTVGEQQLGERLVTVLGGRMERREPAALLDVRIGAPLEEERGGLLLPGGGGALERRHLELVVPRDDIDERTALDEDARGLGSSEERGQMERREAVVRPCADQARVDVQQLARGARMRPTAAASKTSSSGLVGQELVDPRLVAADRRPRGAHSKNVSSSEYGGRAAAEEPQLTVGVRPNLVPRARRDEDRIAGIDVALVTVDLHAARALQHDVDLLGARVVVAARAGPGRKRRLGKALLGRAAERARREGRGSSSRRAS